MVVRPFLPFLLLLVGVTLPALGPGAPAPPDGAPASGATDAGHPPPAAVAHAPASGAAEGPGPLDADALGETLRLGGLRFEPNEGQAPEGVRFVARALDHEVHLLDRTVFVGGPDGHVAITFPAGQARAVVGEEPLGSRSHHYLGADPAAWRTDLPQYRAVRYVGLHGDGDLLVHSQDGALRFDHVLAPGADPAAVRFVVEDATALRLEDGRLVAETPAGTAVLAAPVLYQEREGGRDPVAGGFRLLGGAEVGYWVGPHDAARPLVIDPTLAYSTFFGTGMNDYVNGMAVHDPGSGTAHDVVLTGWYSGTNVPSAVPAGSRYTYTGSVNSPTGDNVWVAKLRYDHATATATALWFAVLGSSAAEQATAVAVTAAGEPVVTGETLSDFFPTVGAVMDTTDNRGVYNGSVRSDQVAFRDLFVSKLAADGSALLFSTFYGGGGDDEGRAVAVDGTGRIVVTGRASWHYIYSPSRPFPVKAAFQPQHGNFGQNVLTWDAFVLSIDASTAPATIVFATTLGGAGADYGYALALDAANNIHVGGETVQPGTFPTSPGAFQVGGSGSHGFVAKYTPAGARSYATLLGGSGTDSVRALDVGAGGTAWVAGYTTSADFPVCTVGSSPPCAATPVQSALQGGQDGFVAAVDPTGAGLAYGTYLGSRTPSVGSGLTTAEDWPLALAFDAAAGHVTVAGRTQGVDFPTNGLQPATIATKPATTTGQSAFLVRIDPAATAPLLFSTYFGGSATLLSGLDYYRGIALALDDRSNTYLAGYTTGSSLFPLQNATQALSAGAVEGFVAVFEKAPPTAVVQASATGLASATARPATLYQVPTSTDVALTGAGTIPGDLPIGTRSWRLYDGAGALLAGPAGGTVPPFSPLNLTTPGLRDVCFEIVDTDTRTPAWNTRDEVCLRVEFLNRPPVAAFTATPATAGTGQSVAFTESASDPDGSVASWAWDFGDGATSAARNPTHAFAAPGTYTVRLTVTDDRGATHAVTRTVTVVAGPDALFTVAAGPHVAGLPVAFTDASSSPGPAISSWHWDFGDGTTRTDVVAPAGPVAHTYAAPGTYTVRLTVTAGGMTDDHALAVEVGAPSPEAAPDAHSTPEGTALVVPAPGVLGNDAHPLGAPLSAVLVTPPAAGTLALAADGGFTYTPPPGFLGTVVFQYAADDGGLASDPTDVTVEVRPFTPPVADFVAAAAPLRLDLEDRSHAGDHEIVSWRWDFGDGTTGDGGEVGHAYAASGQYLVTLTVTDAHGLDATTSRLVGVHGLPLVAGEGGGAIVYAGIPGAAAYGGAGSGAAGGAPAAQPSSPSSASSVGDAPRPVNRAPVAVVAALRTARVGDTVLLDGAASHDPDDDALRFAWRQDEGPAAALEGAQTALAAFRAEAPGRHVFALAVTDGFASARRTVTVEVVPAGGLPAGFLAAPRADPAEVHLVADPVPGATYGWDLGDGTRADGAEVVHRYAAPGTYVVRLEVRTDAGTGTAVQTVAAGAPTPGDANDGAAHRADPTDADPAGADPAGADGMEAAPAPAAVPTVLVAAGVVVAAAGLAVLAAAAVRLRRRA